MTPKKHQSTIAIVVGAMLMTMCYENSNLPHPPKQALTTQTGAQPTSANYTFDGKEGDPITLDVANRWISNFSNQNLGKVTAQFFGRKSLEKILATNGSIGIRFYYSIDDSNNSVVYATGANSSGQDFTSDYQVRSQNSPIALTSNASSDQTFSGYEADSITTDVSKHWKNNYDVANPSGIQAHFFGFEIIKQILAETGCVGIRGYYALNDIGVQQFLLVGVTSSGQNILPITLLGGRTADDGTIGDLSVTCPTACSGH